MTALARGTTPNGILVELLNFDPDVVLPDVPSEYDDFGEKSYDRFDHSGVSRLLIAADGIIIGTMTYHPVWYGPNPSSRAFNQGLGIAPEFRGKGIGTICQRLIVDLLFATTDIFRIEASTDVTNIGEQKALERAGFTKEGLLRGAQVRADGRHDLIAYSFLRTDPRP